MKINNQTKISIILKQNNDAIEAIASINPHFNKLRNPILRKVLAPRVTIADAARIGKCAVSDILNKLSTIGFEIENENEIKTKEVSKINQPKDYIAEAINSGKIKTLDVRPVLNAGADPFNSIMQELKKVPDGFVLEVINSFEPTPLIKILNKKGYESFVKTDGGAVYTYFLKVIGSEKEEYSTELVFKILFDEMAKEKVKFSNKLCEVDVRDLEMPLPMVTILNELESLPEGHALFVHHKKIPQYLLPELEERQFKIFITEIEEGNVKLLIHK
ncbi:MAG: DUF2249 domain-containing protein [Bacteroidia bacterium]